MSKKLNEVSKMEHAVYEDFRGEIEKYWDGKNFGVTSNYKELKRVMLHKPDKELETVIGDEQRWLWDGTPDIEQAKSDFENLRDTMESEGIEVNLLGDAYKDKAKQYFMRDQAIVTPFGAVIGRMALDQRKGEEKPVMKRLVELDIPVIYMVQANGTFEPGNFMWIDDSTAMIGEGVRTNFDGIDQVRQILGLQGIEVLEASVPSYYNTVSGYVHLDVSMNILDEDLAVVYPEGLPYWVLEYLVERDFELIEVSRKEMKHMGTNVLPIAPRKIIAAEGNKETKKLLKERNVDIVEVPMDELIKGGGGPRCCTLELLRK
ncbi:MAG: dimethylarginine dimethylaminohydrolase family protein [Thermoplasmatota archaeon]